MRVLNLRRLALGIQLGGTETFFGDERGDFIGLVLLHGLQESLIAPTPVLTLRGGKAREVTTVNCPDRG